jgi:hypothetical protein
MTTKIYTALSDHEVIERLGAAETALRELRELNDIDPRPDAHDRLAILRHDCVALGSEVGNRFAPDPGRAYWDEIPGRELPHTLAAQANLDPAHTKICVLVSQDGPFLWPRGVPLCLEEFSRGDWRPFKSSVGWIADEGAARHFSSKPVRLDGWRPETSLLLAPHSALSVIPVDPPVGTVARFFVDGLRLVNL